MIILMRDENASEWNSSRWSEGGLRRSTVRNASDLATRVLRVAFRTSSSRPRTDSENRSSGTNYSIRPRNCVKVSGQPHVPADLPLGTLVLVARLVPEMLYVRQVR